MRRFLKLEDRNFDREDVEDTDNTEVDHLCFGPMRLPENEESVHA